MLSEDGWLYMLRMQQLRLWMLKGMRVIFGRQENLRQILLQPAPSDFNFESDKLSSTTRIDNDKIECSDNEEDEEDIGNDRNMPQLLTQQLMQAATQPSLVKAIFSREELEVIINKNILCTILRAV